MDPDSLWQILVFLLCLALSAFFSSSETALMSVNRIRIRRMADNGEAAARRVIALLENQERWLSAILVGNNIVNIAASSLATSIAITVFGNAGVGIATGVVTLLVLIFSEITPKSLASIHADLLAMRIARPINAIAVLLQPVVVLLSAVTRGLIRLLGAAPKPGAPNVTEEELRTMVDVSHEEGVLEGEERRLLQNVFEFGDMQVHEIMVPRTDITAVDIDADYDEILEAFQTRRCSRIPVYEDSIDRIIGLLHIKDFFLYGEQQRHFDLRRHVRRSFYTMETKRIADLFEEMRGQRQQMAVVVDEYGGTAGIVTMQDIIEVIFGDIDDEYDDASEIVRQVGEREFWVEGSLRLKDLNDLLHLDLESDKHDTIGGLITGGLGRLPRQGDQVTLEDGLRCQVLETDRNRARLVRLTLTDPEDPENPQYAS